MGVLIQLLQGLGLSAACGLNAYLPLLVVGILAHTPVVQLSSPYDFIAHPLVLALLVCVAALDWIADKVPGLDTLLHIPGIIIHPIAGGVLSLISVGDSGTVHPAFIICLGALLAAGVHFGRMGGRVLSTVGTAGLANPFISLLEDFVAVVLAILVFVIPVCGGLTILFVLLASVWIVSKCCTQSVGDEPSK